MEVRDQLLRLVRLQGVVLGIRQAREEVEGAPAKLEEIEARFRERNAEYVAVRDRHDALEADQRTRTGELEQLEESRKKYMADLMKVQNQREYAAMLHEIDAVKSQIAEHEEAILKDMEELESVKTELGTHEAHIQEERIKVEKERGEVEAAAEAARKKIVELEQEQERIDSELPRALAENVRRLVDGRQGNFLSRAEDGICQSCFVRVRPQGFQEIKLALKVHSCSNCKRLLYHEPSLLERADSGDKIEAVNGGTV